MSADENSDTTERKSNASERNSPSPPPVKTPAERVMPPVVYQLPGMNTVSVHKNLKYTTVDNPNLLMDVYTPAELPTGEHCPIVLCIHGAAGAQHKAKDWGIFQSWGRLLAAAGMIGVTFTHRLGYPRPMLTQAADDVRSAIAYVRANAGSFSADPDRLALFAWSGGGPLLAPAVREQLSFIRCLVAFYAFLDIQQSSMFADNASFETLKAFSPAACISADASAVIPIFVARAGQDEMPEFNDSIDRFTVAALAANAPITLMNHPHGEHGFDNQNNDARSREIIRAALAFLETHLHSSR
jgi:acetyl esterase/lipase